MAIYILLTRLNAAHPENRKSFLTLHEAVKDRIENECPQINWTGNYAVSGPYDYLDIFEAPSNEVAAHVALIVRTTGGAETEIWNATKWNRFKTLLQHDEQVQSANSLKRRRSTDKVEEADRESFPASDPPAWTGAAAS